MYVIERYRGPWTRIRYLTVFWREGFGIVAECPGRCVITDGGRLEVCRRRLVAVQMLMVVVVVVVLVVMIVNVHPGIGRGRRV